MPIIIVFIVFYFIFLLKLNVGITSHVVKCFTLEFETGSVTDGNWFVLNVAAGTSVAHCWAH